MVPIYIISSLSAQLRVGIYRKEGYLRLRDVGQHDPIGWLSLAFSDAAIAAPLLQMNLSLEYLWRLEDFP